MSRIVLSAVLMLAIIGAAPIAHAQGNFNFRQGDDDGFGVYTGTVDNNIEEFDPDSVMGSNPIEFVDSDGLQQILLRFDDIIGTSPGQIPPASEVVTALLILHTGIGSSPSGNEHYVHRLLHEWSGDTITWNNSFGGNGVNADGFEASVSPIATIPSTGANATIVLDVTATVAAWAAGAPNFGFALLPGGTDGLGIQMSEAPTSAVRPSLHVIAFPAGGVSYADAIVGYSPVVTNEEPALAFRQPSTALGPPDAFEGCGGGCSVSLGPGGSITLKFIDNSLTGSGDGAADLWIFEVGPDVEDTFVSISKDALLWHNIGKVFGATAGIDIDGFGFTQADTFSYVRLQDDPLEGQVVGISVGADIDAVGAISSAPPVLSVPGRETPVRVWLGPLRPNPARGGSTLHFTLAQRSRVELLVTDIMGRRTRRLDGRGFDAGTHSIHWDGYDDAGSPARPGVYFVRLILDGRAAGHQRLAVLR